jgi:hypothetical protein
MDERRAVPSSAGGQAPVDVRHFSSRGTFQNAAVHLQAVAGLVVRLPADELDRSLVTDGD